MDGTAAPGALMLAELAEMAAQEPGLRQRLLVEPRPEAEFAAPRPRPGMGAEPALADELLKWRKAFVGQPRLAFLHACVVIRIRRRLDLDADLPLFRQLWDGEAEALSRVLDLKWLLSAADTMVDHPRDGEERALALAAAMFAKTVKICETEHRARGPYPPGRPDLPKQELFDGLMSYSIGVGNLVDNLEARVATVAGPPAATLLRAVWGRVARADTALTRVR